MHCDPQCERKSPRSATYKSKHHICGSSASINSARSNANSQHLSIARHRTVQHSNMYEYNISSDYSTVDRSSQETIEVIVQSNKLSTKERMQNAVSRYKNKLRRLVNLAYERQWKDQRKPDFARTSMRISVDLPATRPVSRSDCRCAICPCPHMR